MAASPLSALTEELMIGLNVSNEQHTMQQEQISYDQGKNMLSFFMKILNF
jgi:hypothetical protein